MLVDARDVAAVAVELSEWVRGSPSIADRSQLAEALIDLLGSDRDAIDDKYGVQCLTMALRGLWDVLPWRGAILSERAEWQSQTPWEADSAMRHFCQWSSVIWRNTAPSWEKSAQRWAAFRRNQIDGAIQNLSRLPSQGIGREVGRTARGLRAAIEAVERIRRGGEFQKVAENDGYVRRLLDHVYAIEDLDPSELAGRASASPPRMELHLGAVFKEAVDCLKEIAMDLDEPSDWAVPPPYPPSNSNKSADQAEEIERVPPGMDKTMDGQLVRLDELTEEARPSGEWAKICSVSARMFQNRWDRNRPGATWRVVVHGRRRYRIHVEDLPEGVRGSKRLRDEKLESKRETSTKQVRNGNEIG